MQTPLVSILAFILAAFLGAGGQFLYKLGATRATGGWSSYLLNLPLWGGVMCYIAVMVLFVYAFKKGGALTVLYPIYASTFIWAAIMAWLADGVAIRPVHLGGMALLIGGMFLMGR